MGTERVADAEWTTGPRRKRRRLSPITLRITAVNILALAILVAGLLYLGEYQRSLVQTSLEGLKTQGELIAGAIAEGAFSEDRRVQRALDQVIAQQLVRRLTESGRVRARLFDPGGNLVADSRQLAGASRAVIVEELPPPESGDGIGRFFVDLYGRLLALVGPDEVPPLYIETPVPLARDYHEVVSALSGDFTAEVRRHPEDHLVLSVAVPVQRYRRVLGALMLTMDSREIERTVRAVRLDILKVFAVALTITVILSIYLAGTIAHPIRRLASAAERMKRVRGRKVTIPDFTSRDDEVGDLSGALREMTEALWRRMDAIERFAADVAHEIKNPLSSLRSAVETAARVKDPDQQRRLMTIILEDVQRLDRLITDISNASRLDAELSRVQSERVDVGSMLKTLSNIHSETADSGPELVFDIDPGALVVEAQDGQMVQVFRNLIENAISFSPPDGKIVVSAARSGDKVRVEIADDGLGIPEGKEDDIFERFYSERPEGEKFGIHSGLGLSISRQIVEAHGGTIEAVNRHREGVVIGACFTVLMPAV
ncbi:MAG: HAMP domain-containing protein [Alphaproteobacteria bacterium]|nr:HAMP domain-containing protein [Alphaproteobacteria bacterium]